MACLLGLLTLNQNQVRASIDVDSLTNTATDFLHFVTAFFEVISQSEPHIYHSALQLTSPSSMIRELYTHQICSPVSKVVTGIAASEDSCVASIKVKAPTRGVWSPSGRLIATYTARREIGTIEVRDSDTLEMVSALEPPAGYSKYWRKSVAFSPDGCLLACSYNG